MRLLVLGLDALDPDIVERYGLEWFKQKYYGRHYVGFLKTVYTPIAWTAMLTGINPEERGFDIESLDEMRLDVALPFLIKDVYKVLYRIKKRVLPGRSFGIRKFLRRVGVWRPPPTNAPEHLRRANVLYRLEKDGYRVVAFNVPGYNETGINEYFRSKHEEIMKKDDILLARSFVDEALKETERRVRDSLNFVERGYDLVFVYSPLPDIAYHVYSALSDPRATDEVIGFHYRLKKVVKPLYRKAIDHGYIVMIVSDHGFDLSKSDHAEYGFWSFNRNAGCEIKVATDVAGCIEKVVRNNRAF